MKSVNEQLALIERGAVEIIQREELKRKMERARKDKKPLIVKAGFDPTAPDIHLGHTVLLRKLRHFQECGHKVVFLIGDATALVGDPSGQSQTRKMMTWAEVEKNAKTYEAQVGKILKIGDKKLFERQHNSVWFRTRKGRGGDTAPFAFEEFVGLARKYTVARLLERDDFQKRLKENKPISFLELFYPLMQGYDSVMMKADVELGGTDQKFNMLVGRNLQQAYGVKEPQVVITMPLLEGTDGVDKMSKSLGNYIGIDESPQDIFGKIMSISDALMMRYYELLTDEPLDAIKSELASGALHPKDAKERLGECVVSEYYGAEKAREARGLFQAVFSDGKVPRDMPEVSLNEEAADLIGVLKKTGLVPSSSEAKRLIAQGAVSIDGVKYTDPNERIPVPEKGCVIKIGKRRFARLFRR